MKVINRNELIQMYTNKIKNYLDLPILVIDPQKIRHYVKSIKTYKLTVNMIVISQRITYKIYACNKMQ